MHGGVRQPAIQTAIHVLGQLFVLENGGGGAAWSAASSRPFCQLQAALKQSFIFRLWDGYDRNSVKVPHNWPTLASFIFSHRFASGLWRKIL
jgi:hypothetical protein